MSDSGEVVADALVAFLNDSGRGYSMAFAATNPEDPDRELDLNGVSKLHEGLKVFVVPFGEVRERIDGAAVNQEITTNVFISRLRNDAVTKKQLNGLVKEIVESLDFESMGSHEWVKTEIISKYDAEQLRTRDRFLSVFGITHYDIS